jgi:hypothetical protein
VVIRKRINEMVELREQLIALLFVVLGILIIPLVMIALDYWAGIRKARKRGEPIKSDKMKRTIYKVSKYYNGIFALMVLDVMQISGFVFLHLFNGWDAYTFPLFTFVAVLFVASVEVKSIVEPADVKERREMKDVAELAKAIAEHKSDPKEIAEAIAEYLNKKD